MLIQTQNLTKRYGDKTVVQQLNLSIPQGQLVALLGPNGAGKSTTIKMLTGLLSPSEGSIIFQGQQLSRSDYQRQLGVVFQDRYGCGADFEYSDDLFGRTAAA